MAEGGTLDAEPSLDTNGSNKRNAEEAGLEEATGGNGYDRQANMRRRQELMQQQRDKQEQQRKLEIEIRLQQAEEKRLKLKQLKKVRREYLTPFRCSIALTHKSNECRHRRRQQRRRGRRI